jgi:hypothetical protein
LCFQIMRFIHIAWCTVRSSNGIVEAFKRPWILKTLHSKELRKDTEHPLFDHFIQQLFEVGHFFFE